MKYLLIAHALFGIAYMLECYQWEREFQVMKSRNCNALEIATSYFIAYMMGWFLLPLDAAWNVRQALKSRQDRRAK